MTSRILVTAALSVLLGMGAAASIRTIEPTEIHPKATITSVARLWDNEPTEIVSTQNWLFGADVLWHRDQPVVTFRTGEFNHLLSRSGNGIWESVGGASRGEIVSMSDQFLASLHRSARGFQFVRLYDSQSKQVGANDIDLRSFLTDEEAEVIKYKFVDHAEYIDDTFYGFLSVIGGETPRYFMMTSDAPDASSTIQEVTSLSGRGYLHNLPVLISNPDLIRLVTSGPDEQEAVLMHITRDGGRNWSQQLIRLEDDQQEGTRLPVQLFRRKHALGLIYLFADGSDKIRYYYSESANGGEIWKPSILITEFAPYEDEGLDYTDLTQMGEVMIFAHISHGEDGEEGRVLLSSDGIEWVQVDVGKQFRRAPDWIAVSANKAGTRLVAVTTLSRTDRENDRLFMQELQLK